jgi:hypothetical protein
MSKGFILQTIQHITDLLWFIVRARVSAKGGRGRSPPSNDSRGDIPLNLIFLGNILSVIFRHLEAELSILCL